MNRKILFLYPPVSPALTQFAAQLPPLTIETLAANVRDLAETELMDCRGTTLFADMPNLKKMSGMGIPDVLQRIRDSRPNIVVMAMQFTSGATLALDTATAIKGEFPEIKIWTGGHHAAFTADQILSTGTVDVVARSEGDRIIRELVVNNGNASNILGCSFRNSRGEIMHNPNLSVLNDLKEMRRPFREMTEHKRYTFYGVPTINLETSRGCSYKCDFCSVSAFNAGSWRGRPPMDVVDEIEDAQREFGIDMFTFSDPNFFNNAQHVEAVCGMIEERNLAVRIFAPGRVDTMARRPDLVEKMARAGFFLVLLGIESFSQVSLDSVGKHLDSELIDKAVANLHANDIATLGSFVIGFPSESNDMIKKTMERSLSIGVDLASYCIYTPYPGTDAYAQAKQNGTLLHNGWDQYDNAHAVIRTPVDSADLENLLIQCRIGFGQANAGRTAPTPNRAWIHSQSLVVQKNIMTMISNGEVPPGIPLAGAQMKKKHDVSRPLPVAG
jgi:anaerobic magnesium-protoporphyrin IX monomethyl ester cyclase